MTGVSQSPLRVEFDRQIFVRQFKGGVTRYFAELISTFRSHPELGVEALLHAPFIVSEMEIASEIGRRIPHPFPSRLTRRLAPYIAELACKASRGNMDRIQVRHYTQYSIKHWKQEPGVTNICTVYDMIPEKFPEYFPDGNPHQDKDFFIRNCDGVICISETTRRDLLAYYGPIAGSIHVIPLGVGPTFSTPQAIGPRPAWLPTEDYAVFVGNRARYKDFSTALLGIAQSQFGPKTLLCVGGGRFVAEERELINQTKSSLSVVRMDLSDEDLILAYQWASFYVSASRYEGFGLPTLEALISGCPVVLSDNAAHREVGEDHALFFSCGDEQDLSQIIDSMHHRRDPHRPLLTTDLKGGQVTSVYTMARKTHQAYVDTHRMTGRV